MTIWKQKKVLVTGAGGFIGSHLCESLVEAGADVTAMLHYSSRSDWGNLEFLPPNVRVALRVVAGNIEDSHFVMRQVNGQEVVFHLAALIAIPFSYVAPLSYVRTNVEGTLNVLESARQHGVGRVVHTSTSETYGSAIYSPMDEKHPLQGQSPYSASKIGADKIAESYHRAFNVPVTTLRPFNTYGPRQSARAVIPTIISQALSEPQIRLGSLRPIRDLNFVKDTVAAFLAIAAADDAIGKTINAGSCAGITIGDLAALILELMDCKKPIVEDSARLRPDASEVLHLVCDNRLALAVTGWKPSFTLRQGLRETIDFVTRHPDFYKGSRYTV
jgi:NAD dependent epimerase/dehydratase